MAKFTIFHLKKAKRPVATTTNLLILLGSPNGTRTRVFGVRGRD